MSSEGNDTGGDGTDPEESGRGGRRDAEHATDTDPSRNTRGRSEEAGDSARGKTSESAGRGTGESVGRRLDSARETLSRSGPRGQLMLVVGLFAAVGFGVGVAGSVITSTVGGSGFAGQLASGIASLAAFIVVLFLGIAIAALGGLRIAADIDGERTTIYLTSFVANTVGYVVMGVVGVVLIGTAGIGFGDLLLSLLLLGLVAGAVGCSVSALHRRVIGPSV